VKNVNDVCAAAEARLGAADAAFLGDLGVALAERFAGSERVWQYRSVFDRLLRLLAATPGSANLVQALRLVSAARACGRSLERYAASQLAAGHAPTDLAAVLFGGGGAVGAAEELRACVVHELVLRGVAVYELPYIAGWANSPHWRHHPLGWLPLELSEIERDRDLPSYSSRGGSSHSMPYGPSSDRGKAAAPSGAAGAASALDVTTDTVAASISSAVENWTRGSNGRIEARVFEFAEPIGPETVPATVLASGLACLRDRKPKSAFSTSACTPAEAWRVLFAAASTGGAYNSGCFGAYGRLFAWRSMAGLAGATEGATATEVAERALLCTWYLFDADSPWFEQVAWDIGMATLDPSRARLAVLASTDTD